MIQKLIVGLQAVAAVIGFAVVNAVILGRADDLFRLVGGQPAAHESLIDVPEKEQETTEDRTRRVIHELKLLLEEGKLDAETLAESTELKLPQHPRELIRLRHALFTATELDDLGQHFQDMQRRLKAEEESLQRRRDELQLLEDDLQRRRGTLLENAGRASEQPAPGASDSESEAGEASDAGVDGGVTHVMFALQSDPDQAAEAMVRWIQAGKLEYARAVYDAIGAQHDPKTQRALHNAVLGVDPAAAERLVVRPK